MSWPPAERNRGIRLTTSVRYQCSPGSLLEDFVTKVGLVENCVEPFPSWMNDGMHEGFPPEPRVCGFCTRYLQPFAGGASWPATCSPLQRNSTMVQVYRVSEAESYGSGDLPTNDKWAALKQALHEHGPVKIAVAWTAGGTNLDDVPSPGYLLADGLMLQKLDCFHGEGSGHVVELLGYREDDDGARYVYLQNSSSSHSYILRADFNTWGPGIYDPPPQNGQNPVLRCKIYGVGGHLGDVLAPEPMSRQTETYEALCDPSRPDIDLDGRLDFEDSDLDGDEVFNRWDLAPYNPMVGVDVDADGWSDNLYRRATPWPGGWGPHEVLGYWWETCEPMCETLVSRGVLGSAQSCKDGCEWDRCMMVSVKNKNATPCDWECAFMDRNAGEDTLGDMGSCEIGWRNPACHEQYANGDNAEGDPDTRMGEACLEDPSPSLMQWHQQTTSGIQVEPVGDVSWLVRYCDLWSVRFSYWALGGAQWDAETHLNRLVSRGGKTAVTDTGACACVATGDATQTDSEVWDQQCKRSACADSEISGTSWRWDPIHSGTCVNWPKLDGAGHDEDECLSLSDRYEFSEDPPRLRRGRWIWDGETKADTGQPQALAGNLVKLAVSWRFVDELGDKSKNRVVPMPEPLRFPSGSAGLECHDLAEVLAPEVILTDAAAQAVEVGRVSPRLQGLVASQDGTRLYLVGYDRFMDGALDVRQVAVPPGTEIPGLDMPSAVARLERSLLPALAPASGPETGGETVTFYVEQESGAEPGSPGAGGGLNLWVGLFDRAEASLERAGDIFGPSDIQPAGMSRPRIVFEPLRGRLLLVGGGEEGRTEAWSYAPGTGQWRRLDGAGLPDLLKGVSVTLDPIERVVYVMGEDGQGQGRLWEFRSWQDRFVELEVPGGQARGWAALGVDRATHRLLVYGGRREGELLGDLWSAALPLRDWRLEWAGGEQGPQARSDALLVPDGRLGRHLVAGGVTAEGPRPFEAWSFSHGRGWIRRPLRRGGAQGGIQQVDQYQAARYVYQGSEDSVGQGLLTVATLRSQEPCVGVEVRDSSGKRISGDLECRDEDRQVVFWALPGERYFLDVFALPGFPGGAVADVDVEFEARRPEEAGRIRVGRARDLAVVGDGRRLAVLTRRKLEVYDLSPWNSRPAGMVRLQGLGTDMAAMSGRDLLVSLVGRSGLVGLHVVGEPELVRQWPAQAIGRRVVFGRGQAYLAGLTRVRALDLAAGGAEAWSLETGELVTGLALVRGFLLVAGPGRLRAYDVTGPMPLQTDEESLWGIAEGMLVHGRTVAVGECNVWEWLRCELGWRTCERRGLGELFVLEDEGRIELQGSYGSDWSWPAYVETWAHRAYGLAGRDLVVEEVGR